MQLPINVASKNVVANPKKLTGGKVLPDDMGAAANATAIAGRNMLCIMRMPIPNPAWASWPKRRRTPIKDRHQKNMSRNSPPAGRPTASSRRHTANWGRIAQERNRHIFSRR